MKRDQDQNFFKKIILSRNFLLVAMILISVVIALQQYLLGPDKYNNYIIFRNSFQHLVAGMDLYGFTPDQHDLYLYSPPFAVMMLPFAYLPDLAGLLLWTLINAFSLYFAIRLLPNLSQPKRVAFFFIIFLDMVTALQNMQTNSLIAGCLLLAFACFERQKVFLAALCITLCFYVKIFGLLGAGLFLFYPQKDKFILGMLFWTVVIFFIPLIFVPFHQFQFLYESWMHRTANMQNGHSNHLLSVMDLIKAWFGTPVPLVPAQITGLIILALPLLRISQYKAFRFRELMTASLLVWCVIFNHLAESPSFVIALCGVALWFVNEKATPITIFLLALTLLLSSLSPTDLFPKYLREHYVIPYVLKGLPCVLVWIYMQYELLTKQFADPPAVDTVEAV
jgi:hypothetical protein